MASIKQSLWSPRRCRAKETKPSPDRAMSYRCGQRGHLPPSHLPHQAAGCNTYPSFSSPRDLGLVLCPCLPGGLTSYISRSGGGGRHHCHRWSLMQYRRSIMAAAPRCFACTNTTYWFLVFAGPLGMLVYVTIFSPCAINRQSNCTYGCIVQ